ncbi:MAG: KEOPS complex subunit Pcc1 [Asgard group archaeon]|nr:KEOPS complex subunit Pcc1 [Asgard group archaeon]
MTKQPFTNAKLQVVLPYDNKKVAQSIFQATQPENQEIPENIAIKAELRENIIYISIETTEEFCDVITTIEDYLEKIDLAQKTIENLP